VPGTSPCAVNLVATAPATDIPTRLPAGAADVVPPVGAAPDDAGAVDWPLADAVRAVTVGPGDSLWLIAARRLGQHATVADIAEAWPEWYAANRAEIGPDPDLLRVGQRLAPP
jgi:nucleoid-associated protein YgaU